MRALAADLWVVEHPLRLLGIEFGTRSTIVRLRDGGLWLHSPGPLAPEQCRALDALGPVRWLVAPNRMHHRFVAAAARAWPAAQLWLAPGLVSSRPDLPAGETLDRELPAAWAGQLEALRVAGAPGLDETVFFHAASRSLLLTDLCFGFGPPRSRWEALLQRANDMRGFGPSRVMRRFAVRDRPAFRASVERIARWNFARIVLAHGELVERDAARLWREAWDWLA